MYWIISYNEKYFRMSDFFKNKRELDWNFGMRFSFQIGDRAYLYCSHPYSKILYEVEVVSIDIPFKDYIDDSQYGGSTYSSIAEYSKFFHVRFRFIRIIDNDSLSYRNLLKHGLNGSIRTPIKCSGELLDYIKKTLVTSSISSKLSLKDCIDLIAKPDTNIYMKYVPLFINEAKSGKNWTEWDKDVFYYYFEKASNGVAYLGNGQMSREDRKKIKSHWMELAPHLKKIADSQDVPLWDEYKDIRRIVRKYTSKNMRIATNRMMASIQPSLLCSEVDLNKVNTLLDYISTYTSTVVPEYDRDNWEEASHVTITLLKSMKPGKTCVDFYYLPWKLLKFFKNTDLDNYRQPIDEEEIVNPETIYEGARKTIEVNSYERDSRARQMCIAAKGCKCCVCGLNFEDKYGDLGKGFIHVHHIVPISTIGKEYELNPIEDLVPVCPNCHAMLHSGGGGKVLTVDELMEIVEKK